VQSLRSSASDQHRALGCGFLEIHEGRRIKVGRSKLDGITADFYSFDTKFFGETAARIINEIKGVYRVVYHITSKPPGTIEWE
jgi:hypothetical protein